MNKVILTGRLTRDPELRYSQGNEQMAITRYSLAVDRRFKKEGEAEADFFNCTVFGKSAEFAANYFKKGMKVAVTGRLQNNNYTNKDGQKVYDIQIVVEEQEFADGKKEGGEGKTTQQTQASNDGFMSIPEGFAEEELPFN